MQTMVLLVILPFIQSVELIDFQAIHLMCDWLTTLYYIYIYMHYIVHVHHCHHMHPNATKSPDYSQIVWLVWDQYQKILLQSRKYISAL